MLSLLTPTTFTSHLEILVLGDVFFLFLAELLASKNIQFDILTLDHFLCLVLRYQMVQIDEICIVQFLLSIISLIRDYNGPPVHVLHGNLLCEWCI